ncbi:MAG TPA: c-type cytochrome [Gammaproteobacteria bacterium]|nr:c-type cytochrome [Gammaproteobacteria bacterium]
MRFTPWLSPLRLFILLLIFTSAATATEPSKTRQLLQLIDYVGVDYAGAVVDGRVENPAEYNEMRDFSAGILQQVNDLPEHPAKAELIQMAGRLAQLVEQKQPAEKVRQLGSEMHRRIIEAYNIIVVPRKVPDMAQAAALYAENCASCHGEKGFGDGPAAAELDPPPINFHNEERYRQRTLYGLHSTISQGVGGTAMPAYEQLSDDERWSLAFYVGAMGAADSDVPVAESPLLNLAKLTTMTPAQAEAAFGSEGAAIMAHLRHNPDLLYNTHSRLDFARHKLADALSAYRSNDPKKAYQYAVEAYLEGFELVEQNVNAFDKQLRLDIEVAMTGLRNEIRSGKPADSIAAEIIEINMLLDQAEELLRNQSLSGGAAFTSAFFILLREGLEALLIVAALVAFLVRTNRRDGLRYIHMGWISAIVLGVLTWWASVSLISISGASREITEGVGAIVATVVLLYVGFWMHDKTSAAKWKAFIDDSMHKALTSGTLWTLTGLSFIAVYREAFETILFYQALWAQADKAGQSMAFTGFLSAVAVLAVLGWLIMKYSVRLPLREFFAVTGGLMFVLAIIFAGKGIAALQEAGIITATPVDFIRIDLLGIYPNMQGLIVQLVLILLAVYLWNKKSSAGRG